MWWEGAQPDKRRQVRQLVDEGRLEFTSAPWVMTDEASPHLYSMLDQMIEGTVVCAYIHFYTMFKKKSNVRSLVVEVSIGRDAEICLVCRSLRARLVLKEILFLF